MDQNSNYFNEMYGRSKEERLLYFKNVNVDHYYQSVINESILDFILNRKEYDAEDKGSFYHLIGPSGVGKSYLESLIRNELVFDGNKAAIEGNTFLSSYCPVPVGTFKQNLCELYRRILYELNLLPSNQELLKGTLPVIAARVKEAIVRNRVKVILLDNADHLLTQEREKSSFKVRAALNHLVNQTGIKILLFSSNMFNLTSCRDRIQLYPSYQLNNKKDEENFREVLTKFETILPLKEKSNLTNCWEYLLEKTDGRIGILKKWLFLCVQDALINNKEYIDYDLLLKNEPTFKKEPIYSIPKSVRGLHNQKFGS